MIRVPLCKPIITYEMIRAIEIVIKHDKLTNGETVRLFEKMFAKYIGTRYAIAVNSGTTALYFSLLACGVKRGDYVITTPATFIATANAITYIGAKPIFVDISLKTYTIDTRKLEETVKQYKDKVKAIIPVHLYGYPCNMDRIIEIAEKYNLRVIEDACQAHGAIYHGKRVGSIGDAGAFSFYPSKNMTVAGDGGMITTNNEEIAEIATSLRDVGRSKDNPYLHERIGYTARMNSINASVGIVQLRYLDEWNEKRREIAKKYTQYLQDIGDIVTPPMDTKSVKSAWHLYVIRTKYRDLLMNYLLDHGIECKIHYPIPVHLQPPYRKMGFREGMYPNAERWSKEVLSLPMYPELTDREIEYVVKHIVEFFEVIE